MCEIFSPYLDICAGGWAISHQWIDQLENIILDFECTRILDPGIVSVARG